MTDRILISNGLFDSSMYFLWQIVFKYRLLWVWAATLYESFFTPRIWNKTIIFRFDSQTMTLACFWSNALYFLYLANRAIACILVLCNPVQLRPDDKRFLSNVKCIHFKTRVASRTLRAGNLSRRWWEIRFVIIIWNLNCKNEGINASISQGTFSCIPGLYREVQIVASPTNKYANTKNNYMWNYYPLYDKSNNTLKITLLIKQQTYWH